jgi:hypothetical protein
MRCLPPIRRIGWLGYWTLVIAAVAGTGYEPRDAQAQLFRLEIVDAQSQHPVPLIELKTNSDLRWVSDNAGVIAIDAPELFDREVWCEVIGHGYGVPADGFGFRGVRIRPVAGGTQRIPVQRTMIAERMGRLTGSGLLAESQKLGEYPDEPESGIVGCDSVRTVNWRGRRFWLWGDTKLHRYPLGIFNMLGGESELSPIALDQRPLRWSVEYFRRPDQTIRGVADIPAKGPVWLGGLTVMRDQQGKEHLVASYAQVRQGMKVVEWGLCEWKEERQHFESIRRLWTEADAGRIAADQVRVPDGHPVRWRDEHGESWVLFAHPLPTLRCRDRYEDWRDPTSWIAEQPPKMMDKADGGQVRIHHGSLAWNDDRQAWLTVYTESGGEPSFLGEVWFSQASSPFGPWAPAVKILTHDNYSFYNPYIHADWGQGSGWLYVEGTYTAEFARRPPVTPRYDYNQILYRVDLDDPRLPSPTR